MIQIILYTKIIAINIKLSFLIHITKNYFNKKTIQLCGRQRISALHLDRILCGNGEEKIFKFICCFTDCYLILSHAFEQSRLHFWRGTVYFISQQNITE